MKIYVLYGVKHKGNTYAMTHEFLKKFENYELTEMYADDFGKICKGCMSCMHNGEETCPHYANVSEFLIPMQEADLIIIATPVYVYGITGQLKSLIDHFAYTWVIHRPNEKMFSKVAVVITQAAGSGTKQAARTLRDNLSFWGVRRVYTIKENLNAVTYSDISIKKKKAIEKQINHVSANVKSDLVKKNFKRSISDYTMWKVTTKLHQDHKVTERDYEYFLEKNWIKQK